MTPRSAIRTALLALALAAPAGCAGESFLERGAHLVPVAEGPLLDRPARMAVLRTGSPLNPDGTTVGGVLVSFGGGTLRAESPNMTVEPPFRGTLRAFLAGEPMDYLYILSEIRARDGRLLGHFLAIPEKIVMSYVTEDGTLFLIARDVRKG